MNPFEKQLLATLARIADAMERQLGNKTASSLTIEEAMTECGIKDQRTFWKHAKKADLWIWQHTQSWHKARHSPAYFMKQWGKLCKNARERTEILAWIKATNPLDVVGTVARDEVAALKASVESDRKRPNLKKVKKTA